VNLKDCHDHCLDVVGLWLLSVVDVHGETSAGYAEYRRLVEKVGELLAVHGGRGNEELEVGSKPGDVLDKAE